LCQLKEEPQTFAQGQQIGLKWPCCVEKKKKTRKRETRVVCLPTLDFFIFYIKSIDMT
jgi:hypothetical protein